MSRAIFLTRDWWTGPILQPHSNHSFTNALHSSWVEQNVISAVGMGAVLRYKVKAIYSKHPERTFSELTKRIGTSFGKT